MDFVNSNSGTSAQDMYAPSTSYSSANINKYAYCQELDPPYYVVPCNISLSISAVPSSNGHYHSIPPPPVSSISPAYGYTGNYPNYAMPITLTTTQVGQVENVTLLDADNGTATLYPYSVGYRGLVSIGNSNIFHQIGATSNHGDNTFNHHMTVPAAGGLQVAATAYINNNNPGQEICINDMALPIGGKFDLNSNWIKPHAAHDLGTAVDVAVLSPQCQPSSYLVNSDIFIQACRAASATFVQLECAGHPGCTECVGTSCHVHCQWSK